MTMQPLGFLIFIFSLQHYELPPEFFVPIMGKRMKYSSCIFPKGVSDDDIDQAEVSALRQVEERAKLADGQEILELGCGKNSATDLQA